MNGANQMTAIQTSMDYQNIILLQIKPGARRRLVAREFRWPANESASGLA